MVRISGSHPDNPSLIPRQGIKISICTTAHYCLPEFRLTTSAIKYRMNIYYDRKEVEGMGGEGRERKGTNKEEEQKNGFAEVVKKSI